MLEINKLKKVYGRTVVLSINELKIEVGKSLGLVGNNGAGKTTLFNLILDLIPATNGEILSKNQKIAGGEDWKKYTGSYLDESFLIGFLTPKEYFEFVGGLYGFNKEDIRSFLEEYQDFLSHEISESKKFIRDLSMGNKSKVGIIAAIIIKPEVLILDEPFSHLDPGSQIRLKKIIQSLKEDKKMTILISSHDLKHVTEICDRIVLLEDGEIKKDLKTNAETLKELEAYFAA